MSIAIIVNEQLWGLLSFHHLYPKRPNALELKELEALGLALGLAISERISKTEAKGQGILVDSIIRNTPFRNVYYPSTEPGQIFHAQVNGDAASGIQDPTLASLLRELRGLRLTFESDSAIFHMGDYATLFDVPDQYQDDIIAFSSLLSEIKPTQMIRTSCALTYFEKEILRDPSLMPVLSRFCGILHLPISVDGTYYISFFRLEHVFSLQWGGFPMVPDEMDVISIQMAKSRLTVHQEDVHGKSIEWSNITVDLAKIVGVFYTKFIDAWAEAQRSSNLDRMKTLSVANV